MVQMSENFLQPEAQLMNAVQPIEVSLRSIAGVVAVNAGDESYEPHALNSEIASSDGI